MRWRSDDMWSRWKHSFTSALPAITQTLSHFCTYEYDYFYFCFLFDFCDFFCDIKTRWLNKNELKWKPDLTAIWYINYSLNLWSRFAAAKFPKFLHFFCLLHVEQKTLTVAEVSGHCSEVFIQRGHTVRTSPRIYSAVVEYIRWLQ